ncbi:MAG: tRNA (adenosine(37)-N6)-threonylcarbamoyltransferase complex ATPase subunit type 1 TsaE [Prolixibacteraceae bacterium]|nr:tRNA (adenosine(37)-N6)-threonylcarbamoyltransferase complex ATPase subunit type 1 TsaE [Prolixibacteraceae bacterium]
MEKSDFELHNVNLEDLPVAAESLIKAFPDKRIFAFYGGMGAGKTTFTQAVCKVLGSVDMATSPTFAIVNQYETADNGIIYHFDFYRIKDISEAFDLGYEDYFFSENYCFIEWPEEIESLLPDSVVKVFIEAEGDARTIKAFG